MSVFSGFAVEDLLTVDGQVRAPHEVYRKVSAVKLSVLAARKSDSRFEIRDSEIQSGISNLESRIW